MAKNLFVGGLPYSTSEQQLEELFKQAGDVVSVKIIMDKITNQSKGFGFVEMSEEEGAQKAIDMFNNYELGGRKIAVSEARPREENPRR